MATVKAAHPDLNKIERQLMLDQPALVRLPSAVKPTAITIEVPINHNPDFMLYHYFIEVKGRMYKREWIQLLSRLPNPERYKVVLCAKSPKDRAKLKRALDDIGIENVDFEREPVWKARWMKEAFNDWHESTIEEKQRTIALVRRMTGSLPAHYV